MLTSNELLAGEIVFHIGRKGKLRGQASGFWSITDVGNFYVSDSGDNYTINWQSLSSLNSVALLNLFIQVMKLDTKMFDQRP